MKHRKRDKLAEVNSIISIATVNVNDLNIIRLGWKNKIQLYAAYKRYFRSKDTSRLKVREWKIFTTQTITVKRVQVSIPISGKIDLRPKNDARDQQRCF